MKLTFRLPCLLESAGGYILYYTLVVFIHLVFAVKVMVILRARLQCNVDDVTGNHEPRQTGLRILLQVLCFKVKHMFCLVEVVLPIMCLACCYNLFIISGVFNGIVVFLITMLDIGSDEKYCFETKYSIKIPVWQQDKNMNGPLDYFSFPEDRKSNCIHRWRCCSWDLNWNRIESIYLSI